MAAFLESPSWLASRWNNGPPDNLMIIIITTFTVVAVTLVYLYVFSGYPNTVKNLQGPPSDHWLVGNYQSLLSSETGVLFRAWLRTYGPTVRWTNTLRRPAIVSVDPYLINYVTSHPYLFDQPKSEKRQLHAFTGPSLLWAEGDDWKRIRKIMAACFAPSHVDSLLPIFMEKAQEAVDKLIGLVDNGTRPFTATQIWSQLTIDIIGLAGFGHSFEALNSDQDPLLRAWLQQLSGPGRAKKSWFPNMQLIETWWAHLLFGSKRLARNKATHSVMNERAKALIARKRRTIEDSPTKDDLPGRDLLSIMVKANLAVDVAPSQRLTDEEMMANIPLFLFAGTITTATLLEWATYSLAKCIDVQRRLRKECEVVPESIDAKTLNALPYLDAVTHELIRLYPTVTASHRQAYSSVEIPLKYPVIGRDATRISVIQVPKGTEIMIPNFVINTYSADTTNDSLDFNPDRHFETDGSPIVDSELKTAWGSTMTFSGGPRACIAYRFAVLEVKAILFTLIRSLEFELPDKDPEPMRKGFTFAFPVVNGQRGIPLKIRPLGPR